MTFGEMYGGRSVRGAGPTGRTAMHPPDRTLLKIILLGESGVGKTSILNRFCDGRFTLNAQSTIGVDFKHRDIALESGSAYRLHVWDTAGQEQFHVVSKPYYRQADAVVLVYDCTSMASLSALDRYIADARELCPLGTLFVLLGNKCDLTLGPSGVTRSVAEQFAKRRGVPIFFETSAANGSFIDEAFELLCRHIANTRDTSGGLREASLVNGVVGTEAMRTSAGRSHSARGTVRFIQRSHVNSSVESSPAKKCPC